VQPLAQLGEQHWFRHPVGTADQLSRNGLFGRANQQEDFPFALGAEVSQQGLTPARIVCDIATKTADQFRELLSS